MKITIEVELDNAAFHDDDGHFHGDELGRILSKISNNLDGQYIGDLEKNGDNGNLRDFNGNNVGSWVVE